MGLPGARGAGTSLLAEVPSREAAAAIRPKVKVLMVRLFVLMVFIVRLKPEMYTKNQFDEFATNN
jgi:hypothetical protein